jgi:hypothetical protein
MLSGNSLMLQGCKAARLQGKILPLDCGLIQFEYSNCTTQVKPPEVTSANTIEMRTDAVIH